MDVNKLREDLKNYVDKTGIKYIYICKKLNIDKTKMSKFKNKKRNLNIKELYKLYNYLHNTL